ncbi:glycosyl transferase family 2 [Halovenus rubra]|uniref:Glycosyl transferase family 2 n=2 Tax=Halovenus rubra TaxID=869890 RepID=A0ACC7DWS8_9EURY|nr:glycosyl transferase family 2 [Halovenus rubra]
MDYLQERIATLHDLTDPTPDAPLSQSAVVVPIAGEQSDDVTPEQVFEALETVGPKAVVVPLRAPREVVTLFEDWVEQFDLSVTVLWCNADSVERVLTRNGLGGDSGKGRDVWLGLGIAADRAEYVAVHDADATTYDRHHVPRLLAPLAQDYSFVKGYYARVEGGRLYGRLVRLLVVPLLTALAEQDDKLLDYLSAFRYPLAGEFALTATAARQVRAQRTWGLEIGLLGEAYAVAGRDGSAQVDLGVHRHDHRPVDGSGGLSTMADDVAKALFRVLADHDIDPEYAQLREKYQKSADKLIEQYAADSSFNGLAYDRQREREQVQTYASSIQPPARDDRLPPWENIDMSPSAVTAASRSALAGTGTPLTD